MRALAGLMGILLVLAPGPVLGEPPPRDREAHREAQMQSFWQRAQEELFAGVALSPEQQAGVGAIVTQAADDRARARALTAIEKSEDGESQQRAREELRELRTRLRDPAWRIDAMRELLSDEQRVVFDRNRRLRSDRLFAEQQRLIEERAQRRGRTKAGRSNQP